MRRCGVDRDVIMKIGGWKMDSVFRRYNIVDERDLYEAAELLATEQKTPESTPKQDATIQ